MNGDLHLREIGALGNPGGNGTSQHVVVKLTANKQGNQMREKKERERKKTRIIQLSESREHSQLSGDGATEGIAAKITFRARGGEW